MWEGVGGKQGGMGRDTIRSCILVGAIITQLSLAQGT